VWWYIKLAIRNILRNKRRMFIAGSAIGIGLASLIFTDALMIGMEDNMIASATDSFLGEGQIHHRQFREAYAVEHVIPDHAEIVRRLDGEPLVDRYAQRTMSFAMITSPANLSAISMFGIDPDAERYLSEIDEALTKGEYFSGESERDVVIGAKLAEILEVDIGDRVVITVAQAYTGDLAQEMFRISGIYKFNIKEMDRAMAFVRLPKAQAMLGIGDGIHEIALKFINRQVSRDGALPFWDRYNSDKAEAVSWTKLLPEMVAAIELSAVAVYIMGVILFGVVSLGIINTLFMSLHERMFEFGVLRAVGTRSFTMARMILFEAGVLGIFSGVLGSIIGLIVTMIVAGTGIDYSGIEFSGVTFRHLLYPVLTVRQFIEYPVAVIFVTMLVAIYPAAYAARMQPAEAMRRSF
jgi:ABC-type lipoprotein release transport system permease subunit